MYLGKIFSKRIYHFIYVWAIICNKIVGPVILPEESYLRDQSSSLPNFLHDLYREICSLCTTELHHRCNDILINSTPRSSDLNPFHSFYEDFGLHDGIHVLVFCFVRFVANYWNENTIRVNDSSWEYFF